MLLTHPDPLQKRSRAFDGLLHHTILLCLTPPNSLISSRMRSSLRSIESITCRLRQSGRRNPHSLASSRRATNFRWRYRDMSFPRYLGNPIRLDFRMLIWVPLDKVFGQPLDRRPLKGGAVVQSWYIGQLLDNVVQCVTCLISAI